MCFLVLESNFQPDFLYSTERECFLNLGYPFLPGICFLQFSKNLDIADQARSADDCLAVEFSREAKSNSLATTAEYLLRSYLFTPRLSIQ